MATDAEIQALKIKRDNAKSAMDNAEANLKSLYTALQACVNGSSTVATPNRPLGDLDSNFPIPDIYELGNVGNCRGSGGNCKTGCCNQETCTTNMNNYNNSVNVFNTAEKNYETAQDEYDNARGIKSDEKESKADRDAKQIRTGYYVFGSILVFLIIVGVFIWFKYLKK